MSWCGGGEIRPTPGVEWRTAAICAVDLVAGKLAALAGLGALGDLDLEVVGIDQIFGGDAEAARGDLLDRRARRWAAKRSRSSPPSPVLERPPIRFIATASVVCASRLIEPKLIAPVAKRLTISAAGSTSSSGTGGAGRLQVDQAADGQQPAVALVDLLGEGAVFFGQIAAHRMLEVGDALRASRHGPRRRAARHRRRRVERLLAAA